MKTPPLPGVRPHGRGAAVNTEQRLSELQVQYDPGEEPPRVATKIFRDHSSSIISRHNSPDLPFAASLNPYRGCEHGCAYCYARPTHEWLGFSAGVDFESRIVIKENAPALLRAELANEKYVPENLSLSGVTDPYQPLEKKLQITRGCLAVLAECRHPVVLITKNHLITRDIDHLAELARFQATAACISITTLDADLARKMEPRASSPKMRLEAI
jgi:DNA repair photolyase